MNCTLKSFCSAKKNLPGPHCQLNRVSVSGSGVEVALPMTPHRKAHAAGSRRSACKKRCHPRHGPQGLTSGVAKEGLTLLPLTYPNLS